MEVAFDAEGDKSFGDPLRFLRLGHRGLYTLMIEKGRHQCAQQRLPLVGRSAE